MMSSTPKDDEYYNRQSNIYSLLFNAYLDKFFLDSVKHFKESLPAETTPEIRNAIFAVSHICQLAKYDLALIIWKIFYDDHSKDANSIKKLNTYLYTHHGFKYKIKETENIKRIRPLLQSARHGFIAHNLMDDSGRQLQIQDLENALQDIRSIFNDLSIPTIDSRVTSFEDKHVFGISFYEKMGIDPLLMSVLSSSSTSETGEDKNAQI